MRGDLLVSKSTLEAEEIANLLNLPLLGVIPEDDEVGFQGSAFSSKQVNATRAFTLLAENLHDGTKKIFDCANKYRGLFGAIKRNIRKRV